jgi:site-specific DNA-adenine methylase
VNKEVYERMRKTEPEVPMHRAVRFLHLNRTALGGIYRVNLDGKFNVAFGGGDWTPPGGSANRALPDLTGTPVNVSWEKRLRS